MFVAVSEAICKEPVFCVSKFCVTADEGEGGPVVGMPDVLVFTLDHIELRSLKGFGRGKVGLLSIAMKACHETFGAGRFNGPERGDDQRNS